MHALTAPRIVVIGDLNGAFEALRTILLGTGLTNAEGRWVGGASELVQMGDIFNRGGGARRALEHLTSLRCEARAAGGDVTILLGNHEVMMALGNESYCTEQEYLSFATERQRLAWPSRVRRAQLRLARTRPRGGPVAPLLPRVECWKMEHVPGRAVLRRALGPRGRLGKLVRSLPVAVQRGSTVFVHAGLSPAWARLGPAGLNAAAREAWANAPAFMRDLPRQSILRASDSPIYDRTLVRSEGTAGEALLTEVLASLGAGRLVVGHTETRKLPGGAPGRILARHGGRLICVDVGLGDPPAGACAALIITGPLLHEWSPSGTRQLSDAIVEQSAVPTA
jgi:hypothetical protein